MFSLRWTIDGPGMNQSTPQPQHWLIVNSPQTYESELGNKGWEGDTRLPRVLVVAFEGCQSLNTRDGEGVNPIAFLQSATTCAKSVLPEVDVPFTRHSPGGCLETPFIQRTFTPK